MKEFEKLDKLCVIAPEYYTFVKDQTEATSPYFNKVEVFVRYNPLAEISTIWTNNLLENFRLGRRINIDGMPSNVSVTPTPLYYLPIDYNYKLLGKAHFNKIHKYIHTSNLRGNLIHAHHTWSAGYVGARLKKEYGAHFVVTGHGYDIYYLPFKDKKWRKKIEYVLNAADHIITVSQSNFAQIKKLDVSTPVTVIPNGFKGDMFFPRDSLECRKILNLPANKKIILTVGSLTSIKGQRYLIEAIDKIISERKDILCIIIGAGNLQNALERQIRLLGLDDYIKLVGGKLHTDIPIWMSACDLFVLPSLNEGNPTVMFEALGCGKTFVGTKVGGVPEVITTKDYGLLVEPADSFDLAEKIMMALDRESRQKTIIEYAERYSWENISKEIVAVYKQVLG